jgi:hypothetical protein
MIVISEASSQILPSASSRDLAIYSETAKLIGFQVYYIPQDFSVCENAENAVYHIPKQIRETLGCWIGYIPTFEHYQQMFEALLEKNIRLINSPDEHILIQEFDNFYPKISDLTAKSKVITDLKEVKNATVDIGFPVFLKGTIQSIKSDGWKSCVAENLESAELIAKRLFQLIARTRGKVIIRQLVKLRYSQKSSEDFPFGREYRVFIYKNQIVGFGYYWEGDDELKDLSESEKTQVKELALKTATLLDVPYISIDIGQLENGEWIVIEVGDPQFSGISQIPILELWNNLKTATTW